MDTPLPGPTCRSAHPSLPAPFYVFIRRVLLWPWFEFCFVTDPGVLAWSAPARHMDIRARRRLA
ncbi:hypothetical protein K466DRAFT_592073 [Polyporus arcularius HHB13444]|uniref:Uncharacterized protein n=1 Tax=Polyporus arcularius HHB13444 TaxID=1314778 RepID=A0A5C3NRS6_9APHY|nr:hypothetical protein K466DRAFT_592073 [Polyporus arcularius HHB13444]